jgi:heme exporter protein CcmD
LVGKKIMTELSKFFAMGGFGQYVFPAYGLVIATLFLQWFIPWRRWQDYLRKRHE